MQETRERIIHILKTRGQSTVDELSRELGLTSVTVRHHLEILRQEDLIAPPEPMRRTGPGRPQHVYRLASQASDLFPKNYDLLAIEVLREMEQTLSLKQMMAAVERIAGRIAEQAGVEGNVSRATRLQVTLQFLSDLGYLPSTEEDDDGRLLLRIANCPYERVARDRAEPCQIDSRVLSKLLGYEPRRVQEIPRGASHCVYVLAPVAG
jgi:predicted ArsR family transcriptional regulator